MIDEAFRPFAEIIERIVSFNPAVEDARAGVRSYIHTCEIELPVELDIARDEAGALRIGTTPPLYHVDTSFRPSFHRLRFTVQMPQHDDGD
jgi:hypothetical protein